MPMLSGMMRTAFDATSGCAIALAARPPIEPHDRPSKTMQTELHFMRIIF
jgi:hypothetical protein